MVITNNMEFKTSSLDLMLRLNYQSQFFNYQGEFPSKMFRLMSFHSIKSPGECAKDELIDLIGRIVETSPPREVTARGNFVIEDAQESLLKCSIWDHHIDAMLPYYNSFTIKPLIVLMQMCRVIVLDGN